MAQQYRCLQDCYLAGAYYHAGDIITLTGVPGPYLDPLTPDAVTAFYAAGPQPPGLVRQQWSGVPVNSPVTCWRQIPGGRFWQLTGLGADLAPIGVV
jgi:hypothetical protein